MLKVGDKVKLIKWLEVNEIELEHLNEFIGDIGIIIRVEKDWIYPYGVEWGKYGWCPMGKDEIELLNKQLLFPFMEEE